MSVFQGADLEALTDEQLALLAHEGCEDAFSQLVQRCASIVRRHAAMYRSVQLEAEDLEQEGLVGLLSAVRTYQESGGASFRMIMMMEKYAAADTMWVLIGAFMVFFMQPGLSLIHI